MTGQKRPIQYVENNAPESLSVPPGFVSLTSLTLKKIVTGGEAAVNGECEPVSIGAPLTNSNFKRLKMSLVQRPWISHGHFDPNPQQDGSEQSEVNMKDPNGACLRRGVIRGCANCHDCVKVTARWRPEESRLPALEDAPVFRPTEEEFKQTLKYLDKIRPQAENYGICRIVPPPSWRPQCLLEDNKAWETSKFSTHVQKINGLQNLYFKRELSRLHEKIETKMPEDAASGEIESCNEGVGDSDETKSNPLVSEFESGPEFTLKSFKKYADDFKGQYFHKNDKAIDLDMSIPACQDQRDPLVTSIEGEYWRIVENPSEEIEVLLGTDVACQNLGSGFPTATSAAKDKAKYSEYVNSGWNMNNIQSLSGSLLPFGCCDTSSVLVPQMIIGMCFSSQCWRNEDHHLYSLSYMHLGSPKVCYGIPGRYSFRLVEVVKKLFPQLAKHPKLFHELVSHISPSKLISEGIPVYRCLQNPLEFVVTFPGAYHSEFSCGFNCSEAVCFAPFNWLPHGQNIVEVYAGYCLKTSISHDKLLLGAAVEAVSALWEPFLINKDSPKTHLWKSVAGKNGILTRLLKARVKDEGIRRKHLCSELMPRSSDEFDGPTKKECSICLYDLYLSAVSCSCSPNRYSCLRHSNQLCSCPWISKHVFFRYEIAELNLLVEALDGNLKAIHSWTKRKICPEICNGSSYDLNGVACNKSCTPANNRGNEENNSTVDSVIFNGMNVTACRATTSGTSGGANKEFRTLKCMSPPAVTGLQNSASKNVVTSQSHEVILLSDDEDDSP
ncbi:hypothetical protein ACS0TY_007318 [Phlomoides rotata]